MPRQPVRFMRVGTADIPDAAAFDAYVGPAGEVVVDHIRGIIQLCDGVTPGGIQFSVGAPVDAVNGVPGGRLTLTPGAPAPAADVAAGTSVRYEAFGSTKVPVLQDGVLQFKIIPTGGAALALDANSGHAGYHQASKNFDVFAFDAGGGNIGIGSGPAWATDASRGAGAGTTEIASASGVFVNANAINLRTGSGAGDVVTVAAGEATYLGSFRATANGIATDTKAKRLLFNAYNAVERLMAKPTTADFNYIGSAYVPFENSGNSRIEMLLGLAGVAVKAKASIGVNPDAANRLVRVKVGLDSISAPSLDCTGMNAHANAVLTWLVSDYAGYPGLGYHYLVPLMYGAGAGTQNWIGSNAELTSGIFGSAFL